MGWAKYAEDLDKKREECFWQKRNLKEQRALASKQHTKTLQEDEKNSSFPIGSAENYLHYSRLLI